MHRSVVIGVLLSFEVQVVSVTLGVIAYLVRLVAFAVAPPAPAVGAVGAAGVGSVSGTDPVIGGSDGVSGRRCPTRAGTRVSMFGVALPQWAQQDLNL